MPPKEVTAEELIKHLTDIPVITGSCADGACESVENPSALTVTPTGEVSGFQAYKYASPEATRRTKPAFIN